MKLVTCMVTACIAAWGFVTALFGERANPEAFWGMVGPLVSAAVSWIIYARVHRLSPVRLTNVMIAGVGVKLLFFSVYVAVMVRVLAMRPEPFIASLVGVFIALHALEAFGLRRLAMEGDPALRSKRA
jgi:hypothetical protein